MSTKTADNGRNLVPHDGVTEWSVCGRCGIMIDWTSDLLAESRDRDDTSCPHCGHADTAWLYAWKERTKQPMMRIPTPIHEKAEAIASQRRRETGEMINWQQVIREVLAKRLR